MEFERDCVLINWGLNKDLFTELKEKVSNKYRLFIFKLEKQFNRRSDLVRNSNDNVHR